MTKTCSRRDLLGLTVAAVGGVTALARAASAGTTAAPLSDRPTDGPPRPKHDRLYWEKSYSGGPVDVTPLPPGRPGKDYRPVVVPTGYTLPWKIVDGVKVFHL